MNVAIDVVCQPDGVWRARATAFPHIEAFAPKQEESVRELERLIRAELARRMHASSPDKDNQGQPLSHWYNLTLRIRRKADEMIGLLRGIIADDEVSDREVEKLAEWLTINQEAACCWPMDVVLERVGQILEDGKIDQEEREDLREIIREIVGAPDESPFQTLAANLPLTRPAPMVIFDDKVFVFTGRFAWGSRSKLQKEVERRGGRCSESVTRKADYVVVGTFGSRDWIHSAYGTKIESAVQNSNAGLPVAIISEDHWIKNLTSEREICNTSSPSKSRVIPIR